MYMERQVCLWSRSRRIARFAGAAVVVTLLTACSKSSQNPTGPTPPSGPPVVATTTLSAMSIVEQTATLTWAAVPGASGYIVEFGSESGQSNLTTINVSVPTATWRDIEPRDTIYVRVKAQNEAGIGPASPEVQFGMPDYRNVIEALFLSTGPHASPPSPRNASRQMNGWPFGSTVVVRVPDEVVVAQFDAVAHTVAAMNSAIGGINLVIVRERLTLADWTQRRPAGITITAGQGACQQSDGAPAACVQGRPQFAGYQSISVRMTSAAESPRTFPHELGHAVGLEHVWTDIKIPNLASLSALTPSVPIMGGLSGVTQDSAGLGAYAPGGAPTLFSDYELEAVRRVYQAGLRPGSTAAEFAARGLIKP